MGALSRAAPFMEGNREPLVLSWEAWQGPLCLRDAIGIQAARHTGEGSVWPAGPRQAEAAGCRAHEVWPRVTPRLTWQVEVPWSSWGGRQLVWGRHGAPVDHVDASSSPPFVTGPLVFPGLCTGKFQLSSSMMQNLSDREGSGCFLGIILKEAGLHVSL